MTDAPPPTRRAAPRRLRWLGLGLSLLAGGCSMMTAATSTSPSTPPPADPLFGLTPGADPGRPPAAPPPAIPPIPIAPSTTSPASLAGRSGGALSIPDPAAPGQLTSAPRDAGGWGLAPNPTPKVLAVPPAGGPAVQRAGSWDTPPAPSADQLRAQLTARGVVDQKVEAVPTGLRLTCYAARPDDPNALRVYEVVAADYAAAAQAILRQLAP